MKQALPRQIRLPIQALISLLYLPRVMTLIKGSGKDFNIDSMTGSLHFFGGGGTRLQDKTPQAVTLLLLEEMHRSWYTVVIQWK